MNITQWLSLAAKTFAATGLETARLDALVLLEDVTGIDRARLLAEPDRELTTAQAAELEKLLARRARHEPLAYVRGQVEFYGRTFVITPAVLQPRPESETMIDLLKELVAEPDFGALLAEKSAAGSQVLRIADVGTGSGALGITAQLELSAGQTVTVDLLEIDPAAAEVAQLNVDKFTLNIRVMVADLLQQTPQNYHVLLCNLPYVPDDYSINQAAGHEPRLAIFGGSDGLNVYRRLFRQITPLPHKPLFILTEALSVQQAKLQTIAEQHGYELVRTQDFIQLFRRHA